MYQINIKGQNFVYRRLNSSVQGSVGVEQVTFSFDESWDGLAKWACFKNDNVPEIHVLLSDDNLTCDVPWEMYTKEGALYIGALGMQDGVVVKPTFWVQVSEVSEGVSTEGATPGEYTPSEIEQLTKVAVEASKKIGNLEDLETKAKQNLVVAINEARRSGSGGGGGSGVNGVTFYPHVDAEGNLSWTNDGGLENPPEVNIMGSDYVLTDNDKSDIANEAAETLETNLSLRETVFIDLDGYGYSQDGIAYPLTNLDFDNIKKYNFVLRMANEMDETSFEEVPLSVIWDSMGALYVSALWYSRYGDYVATLSGFLNVGMDEAIVFEQGIKDLAGEYIVSDGGSLSVDKGALLGEELVGKTVAQYIDEVILGGAW